jgi:hypothetical protein
MKTIIRYTLLLAITTFLITSCSEKGPKEARFIPKDATFVIAVDPGSLQSKLDKGNINLDSAVKKIFGTDTLDSKAKRKFAEFKDAGIDFSEKFFLFITQKGTINAGQSTTINVIGSLKDSAKLLAFIQKQSELKSTEVVKEKNYTYLKLEDNAMISWTDKNVIATFYIYNEGSKKYVDTFMHTNQTPAFNKSDELKKAVDTYYTQAETESLASVKEFTEMFKKKADGYAFSTTNSTINALSMMPMQLPKLEELLRDNFSTSTFNFEDGKVVAKSNFYPNKLMSAILKKYTGPTVNLSMIENYPSQNIDGLMMASFNPEIFGGILKQLEVESLADVFLQKMNISSADLYKCLKGDIAVVVSDFSVTKPANADLFSIPKPAGKFIFNATIGDKTSFAKLMDKAAESGFVLKENGNYKSGVIMQSVGLFLHTDDKNIILSSDSLTYQQYAAKTGKAAISSDVMNQIKGKSTVFYLDIEKLTTVAAGYMDQESMKNSFNFVKSTFKDAIATSDNYDGTKISGVLEVRMKDEKQNSLVSLVNMSVNIATEHHQRKQEWHTGFGSPEADIVDSIPQKQPKK